MYGLRVALAVAVVLSAAWISDLPAEDNQILRFNGSKYLGFHVTDMARYYVDSHPNSDVKVSYDDQYSLVSAIAQKTTDAIMVLGKLDDDMNQEAADQGIQLQERLIGWGGVVMVTHPQNPISELTVSQVRRIFLGQITNWKELGGPDEPIVTITRDEAMSGTETFFKDVVLNGEPTGQNTIRLFDYDIARAIRKQKGAIGDARYSEAMRAKIRGYVRVIAIKQDENSPAIMPSVETLRSQLYPISAPMFLYYDAKSKLGGLNDFVRFCASRGLGEHYADAKR
jgi:phosphate transport system substrate-binding protein